MTFIPKPHEIYKHFKGNLYQIVTIAKHSETGESLVIYQALYGDFQTYARPLDMFVGLVDREKYPEVTQKYRFELQGDDRQNLAFAETTQTANQNDGVEAEPAAVKIAEEGVLDPLVEEFLDTDKYEEKLNILSGLHHRITDEMITTMAVACDVEVPEGPLEERYRALKNCLVTIEKYECKRLR